MCTATSRVENLVHLVLLTKVCPWLLALFQLLRVRWGQQCMTVDNLKFFLVRVFNFKLGCFGFCFVLLAEACPWLRLIYSQALQKNLFNHVFF